MNKMFLYLPQRRSTFLIGFAIGFFFSSLIYLAKHINEDSYVYSKQKWSYQQNEYSNPLSELMIPHIGFMNHKLKLQCWINKTQTKQPKNISYDDWVIKQNLKVEYIDLDRYLYEPNADYSQKVFLESNWLKSKVFITCIVFVEKVKLAESIKNTWSSHCNRIYYFGQHVKDSKIPIINFNTKFKSSWHFLCESMNYIWRVNEILEWIIFIKDETMVIPENLRYIVAPLDYKNDYYLGHPITMWGQSYNVAQAGYVLSNGAFKRIVEIFNTSEKCASGGKFWKKEDYYLGKHLSSMGILPIDTRDEYFRGTFHGYSLQNLMWGVAKPGNYWTHALYPPEKECCSPMSVTFNVAEADKMYTFNYLLYHLKIFTRNGTFGNKHASMSLLEDDVWKTALREEFNIVNLSDISSDTYYEIWRSKYSEPEEFILQNYRNVSDILSSMFTAYELHNQTSDKSSLK